MGDTTIQWTDKTWSPIRARVKDDAREIALAKGWIDLLPIVSKMRGHVGPHCEMCSPGCNHCYSLTNNGRCLPSNGTGLPFDKRSRELVDIFVDEKMLLQPLHWKAPKKIFVENQSDLFGEWVPFEMVDKVFAVMALCQQHTFQVLTKRADRMLQFMNGLTVGSMESAAKTLGIKESDPWDIHDALRFRPFPLPNIWVGVSAEDQQRADERIPKLLQTPAAVRFVSYEPALTSVTLLEFLYKNLTATPNFRTNHGRRQIQFKHDGLSGLLHWVIVGGESGPGARPFEARWAHAIVSQCKAASVPVFVKQMGAYVIDRNDAGFEAEWNGGRGWPALVDQIEGLDSGYQGAPVRIRLHDRKGGDMSEWPEDLRIRQFPA